MACIIDLVALSVPSARAQSSPANQNRSVRVDRERFQVLVIDEETGETIRTFSLGNAFPPKPFSLTEGILG